MSSPRGKLSPAIAIEYFKAAIAYQISANRLYEQIDSQTLKKLPLRDPIYFLYHHAVELALKSCLLSHGLSVRSGHSIGAFFERCRTKGFLGIDDDEHHELHLMQGLVVFLDAADYGRGYRYARQNDIRPRLPWVQEVIGKLIAAVEPHVEAWAKKNGIAGPSEPYSATKRLHFFGKPAHTKQPRPSKPGP
jgi:HEPN domain-containing protein